MSSNYSDPGKGVFSKNNQGSASYQTPSDTSRNLSNSIGDKKLSDMFAEGRGSAKVTVGGGDSENSAAIYEELSSRTYSNDSVRDIGFQAVSKNGNQISSTSDIKDDSIVTVGKFQAQAKSLFQAGLLSKDQNGNYQLSNDKKN